jgi:hypothetical protein
VYPGCFGKRGEADKADSSKCLKEDEFNQVWLPALPAMVKVESEEAGKPTLMGLLLLLL